MLNVFLIICKNLKDKLDAFWQENTDPESTKGAGLSEQQLFMFCTDESAGRVSCQSQQLWRGSAVFQSPTSNLQELIWFVTQPRVCWIHLWSWQRLRAINVSSYLYIFMVHLNFTKPNENKRLSPMPWLNCRCVSDALLLFILRLADV